MPKTDKIIFMHTEPDWRTNERKKRLKMATQNDISCGLKSYIIFKIGAHCRRLVVFWSLVGRNNEKLGVISFFYSFIFYLLMFLSFQIFMAFHHNSYIIRRYEALTFTIMCVIHPLIKIGSTIKSCQIAKFIQRHFLLILPNLFISEAYHFFPLKATAICWTNASDSVVWYMSNENAKTCALTIRVYNTKTSFGTRNTWP